MELQSPLVEENLPEPPIKYWRYSTTPLWQTIVHSQISWQVPIQAWSRWQVKGTRDLYWQGSKTIEAIFIPVQIIFPEPTQDFPGQQHQSQFRPILPRNGSNLEFQVNQIGLEPFCWWTSNQFLSFWWSWWCRVRTGQLAYEEWSMNLWIPSPVQFIILSMSMGWTRPHAPFLQWFTF